MYLYFIQSLCLIAEGLSIYEFSKKIILNLFYSELKNKITMNDKVRCSIGLKNKEICHKQTYVKTKDI